MIHRELLVPSDLLAAVARPQVGSVTVTSLVEAEEVLDRNELRGCGEQELIVLGPALFGVRWRELAPDRSQCHSFRAVHLPEPTT